MRNVLIYRLDGGLGDCLCMTPAIRGLSEAGDAVTVLVPPAYVRVFAGCEAVRATRIGRTRSRRKLAQIRTHYDLAFDLRGPVWRKQHPQLPRTAVFAQWCGVMPRSLVPCFHVTEPDRRAAASFLKSAFGYDGDKSFILIQLHSAAAVKDWPFGIELSEELAQHLNVVCLNDGRLITQKHLKMDSRIAIVDRLELGTLGALMKMAAFAIVLDSGPLHLAAAMGTKCLALFGPTDGRIITRDYPSVKVMQGVCDVDDGQPCWTERSHECGSRCLSAISLEEVQRESLNMLCL